MNLKDKLIRKLLEVGKKHRILVYPTLALVAIISAVSHAVYWGKGNGKKLVASAMVMVMLITQSLFLTSSADTSNNTDASDVASSTDASVNNGNSNINVGNISQDSSDTDTPAADFENLNIYGEENNGINANSVDVQYDENGEVVSQEFDLYGADGASTYGNYPLSIAIYRMDSKGGIIGEFLHKADSMTVPDGATEYDITDYITTVSSKDFLAGKVFGTAYDADDMYISELYYLDGINKKYFEKNSEGKYTISTQTVNNNLGAIKVYFTARRLKYNVRITNGLEGDTLSKAYIDSNPVKADATTGVISFAVPDDAWATRNNFGKLGYTYEGIRDASGNLILKGGSLSYTTDPDTDTVEDLEIVADFKPVENIEIKFDVNPEKFKSIKIAEGMESVRTVKGVYDKNITLPSATGWAELDGYELVGWKDTDTNTIYEPGDDVSVSQLCTPTGNIAASPNVKGKTLEAVWDYKRVALVGHITNDTTGKDIVKREGNDLIVTAQYGDSFSGSFYPVYLTDVTAGTSTNFTCKISDVDEKNIASYGIKITHLTHNGQENVIGYTIGMPYEHVVKKIGRITIPVEITDKNTTKEDGTSIVTTCNITFDFGKRKVSIEPSSIHDVNNTTGSPTKVYDGDNKIKVNTRGSVENLGPDDSGKLFVEFNEDAEYGALGNRGAADAGEDKPLTISGVRLKATDGNNNLLEYYELVDENGQPIADGGSCTFNIGKILRRSIKVSVKPTPNDNVEVLFGQEEPEFKLDIADSVDSLGLTDGDEDRYNQSSNKEAFVKELLGFKKWELYDWARYANLRTAESKKYYVKATFDKNLSNYEVAADGVESSFTVTRESAKQYDGKSGNYTFNREPVKIGEDDVYPGLIITATGNYDKIRLLKGDDTDVIGLNYDAVKKLFGDSIDFTAKDLNYINEPFSFQMYDSKTGAVTTIENVRLSIDTTGPEYVTHTVSPASRELPYFNAYKFGSYYHSQTISGAEVPNMTITIEYKADGCAPAELHYRYVNENGIPTMDTDRTIPFTKNDGRWLASISVGSSYGDRGQLIVYAKDTIGNDSKVIKLKLDPNGETATIEDYDGKNPSKGNYYEWMVENTPPEAEITAQTIYGEAIVASEDKWYNGVIFVANARDDDSGLNEMVWLVTKPGSTEPEIAKEDTSTSNIVNATAYGKVTSNTYKITYQDSELPIGQYYMSGIVYDNAGNRAELNMTEPIGPFNIDCKEPVIRTNNNEDDFNSPKTGMLLEFNVTEGEGESQISRVVLQQEVGGKYDEEGIHTFYPGADEGYSMDCSHQISDNGKYRIVAYDRAGNRAEKVLGFSGISDETPNMPTIVPNGIMGKNGWYVEQAPAITIKSTTVTEKDGVSVSTYYTIINGEKEKQALFDLAQKDFNLSEEGDIVIDAWAKSGTGKLSNHAKANVKVDLSKPVIDMKESVVDAEGRVTINFTAYDTVSGININSAKLNGKTLIVRENDGTISGSFVVADEGTYELTVEDMAGNVASLQFVPLAMSVSPITDITSTGAKIDAKIYTGTYDLSNCYIAYRKAGTTNYETAPANKRTQSYGASLDYEFSGLTPDTVYEYRVYAVTKTSRETKVVEGSFRTGDGKSTTAVYGNVRYANGVPEDAKTAPIYVALFDGNTYIAGKKLEIEGDYNFTNISNGTYRVFATDGAHTQTKSVIVENGAIVYPTDYITSRGVNFVLSNLSTHMVLKDGAVKVTADGLDQVFDRNYTAVITEEDWYAYDNEGASIDITLYADYLDVTDISSTTQGVFADKIGKNNEIVRYIELNVVKTVKNADGEILYTQDVTRLVKPVTIAFPLGDLSGQKIGVASMHGNGNDAQFINWSDSEAVLTKNYISITTSRFSIYALYKVDAAPKSYTVTWKDGDGNTMKVETVADGGSATPPVTTPRKTATDKYTYTFSGWDTDYSKITKDTIISAWFTAKNVNGGNNNDPIITPGDPTNPGGNNGDNSNNNENPESKPPLITNNTPQYSYLGSAQSPNTGDEAPIAVLAFVMLLSMSGMVVVIKKQKKN